MIYPVENTIHSLRNRGKMVLKAIVVAHPTGLEIWPNPFAQKDHLKPKSSFCLFVCLFVFATAQEEWPFCFIAIGVFYSLRLQEKYVF